MDNARRNTSAVEDPGENANEGNGTRCGPRLAANSISASLSSLPPLYPCTEVCAHCGKKVTDADVNGEPQDFTDAPEDCSCECHHQAYRQSEKLSAPQMHIPPGGPNCLPGCGYSGLPCYYCSSAPCNLESATPLRPQIAQGFPTQIYTVELLRPSSLEGLQSGASQTPEQIIRVQSEEHPEASKRRKTCISLVVFLITINVAIAIVRMLSSENKFREY